MTCALPVPTCFGHATDGPHDVAIYCLDNMETLRLMTFVWSGIAS